MRQMSIAAMIAIVGFPTLGYAQMERYDALANSPMAENRPTAATAKLLRDELLFQRSVVREAQQHLVERRRLICGRCRSSTRSA